jgi:hypothetical protein
MRQDNILFVLKLLASLQAAQPSSCTTRTILRLLRLRLVKNLITRVYPSKAFGFVASLS